MRGWLATLTGAAVVLAASQALALDVGDKAPALDIKEWVQGDPVTLDGKNVYVVEFWATWCGPCKQSIPHLCKLSDKYKGKGVEFVGISDETPDEVKAFAKDTKFTYHVACDNNRNTNGVFMEGVAGIPHAFIVDKDGNVAWQGHPMAGLDAALEKVLAGKMDIAKAKEAAAATKEMEKSFASKDLDQISAAADKVLAADPSDETAFGVKYQVLKNKKVDEGLPAWKAFITMHLARIDGDWRALNNAAWKLATEDDLSWRDIGAALKASKKSVDLGQGKESLSVDTLARVYFEAGMLDMAIDTQKKAISLMDKDDKDESMKKTLAYYESCAEVRKSAGGDAGKVGKKK